MFKDDLQSYVLSNPKLVKMRDVGNGLYVLKYSKKVFYDSCWNEFLEHCRGTVVDRDFNLISYPFQKIYNYGIEKQAPVFSELDTLVTAFRKVNGFMVSLSWHNNDILVSTTGSAAGDFVDMAREMMLKHMCWEDWQLALGRSDLMDMTFMFECVHPNDPHIIPEKPGMYILGYREKSWNSTVGHHPAVIEQLAEIFHCFSPEYHHLTVAALKSLVKTVKHEGFVFYDEKGVGAKIKSPYYLTSKWVARNPRTDKLVDLNKDIKHNIDEEYHGLIDAIRRNIDAYTAMNEQERLEWVRNFMESL
jgi:hypothetical protein